MTLGAAISSARAARGLSVRELARALGCRERTVRQWQAGDHWPSLELEARLREVLPEVVPVLRSKPDRVRRRHRNARLGLIRERARALELARSRPR